jgi:hypothetical protein
MLAKKYGPAPLVGRKAEPDGIGKLERSSSTSDPNREQAQLAAELALEKRRLRQNKWRGSMPWASPGN